MSHSWLRAIHPCPKQEQTVLIPFDIIYFTTILHLFARSGFTKKSSGWPLYYQRGLLRIFGLTKLPPRIGRHDSHVFIIPLIWVPNPPNYESRIAAGQKSLSLMICALNGILIGWAPSPFALYGVGQSTWFLDFQ